MFKERKRNNSFNLKNFIKNRRFSELIDKSKSTKNKKKNSVGKIKIKYFKTLNRKMSSQDKLRETEPFKFYYPKKRNPKILKKLISETDKNLNDLAKEISILDNKFEKINKEKIIKNSFIKKIKKKNYLNFENNLIINKYLLEKDKLINQLKNGNKEKERKIQQLEKENKEKKDKIKLLEKKNTVIKKKNKILSKKDKENKGPKNTLKKINKEQLKKKDNKIFFFNSELEKQKSIIMDLKYKKNLITIELKDQKLENFNSKKELEEKDNKIGFLNNYKKSMDFESQRLLNLVEILREEIGILKIQNKLTLDILSK